MRTHRTTGVIVSTALVGALAFGTAGTAFASPDTDPGGTGTAAPAAPDVSTLLAQATALGRLGAVLTPVTEAVKAVLEAPGNKLSAADAAKDADAVKAAIAALAAVAPATPAAPALPATPAVPAVPAAPAAPAAPVLPAVPTLPKAPVLPKAPGLPKAPVRPGMLARGVGATTFAAPRADLTGDALAGLQKAVTDLLKSSTSGDATGSVGGVVKVVTDLVNVLLSSLLGGTLPTADLAGLPKLPALPAQAPAAAPAPAPAHGLAG